VGTCWRRNKASKGYVAARRGLPLVKAIKWGMCELDLGMCQKGGAPLLRGGAFPHGAAHLLRGGAPTPSHPLHLARYGVWGEVAALSHTLGSLMLTCGVPSSLWHLPLGLYIQAFSPIIG